MQACHCFPFNTIYAANMLNTRKQNVNRRVFFSLSAQKSCAKKDRTCTCDFLFCNWLHGNLHKSGPSISDYRTNFRNWKDLQRSRRKTRRTKTRPWKRGHFRVDFWRVVDLPTWNSKNQFEKFQLLQCFSSQLPAPNFVPRKPCALIGSRNRNFLYKIFSK